MMPVWTIVRGLLCLSLLAFIFLFDTNSLSAQSVLVGNQNIELNIDSTATGLAEAFPATASTSGQIGSINVFLDETSAATKIYVGIYADAGGHPGALLTQGSITQFALGTWNTVTVTPVNVSSGTSYWIAILGTTGGKPVFRDRSTTTCHSQTSSQTNLTALPSTWSTGQTWNTCNVSAYAVSSTFAATVLIGNQAVEANLDKNPAGRAEAFAATANTTGSVGAIALYLDATSGSGPVYVGLYADNNGNPGTLLGQGSDTQPVAGSWNQISISSSSITAGHKYWIAVLGTQATSPYFRDRQTSNCHSVTTSQTTLTTLPATWSTGATWATCYISAYGLPAASSAVLTMSASSLSFAAVQGGANPASANVSVTNTGTGTLSFTVASDASWLSATPTSGTAPQTLQVSASIGSLTAGTYTGHVTVTAAGAQGSPSVVTVTLTVAPPVPPAVLSVSPSALSMSATQGGTNPSAASVNVTNTGGGTLSFTAASDSAWLSVSPASGTAPQTLQVSASIGSLTAATYTGHVTVTAAGAQGSPSVVTVTLTLAQAVPPAVLSVSPATLSMSATQGGSNPSAASVNVTNTGGGTLSFTAASDSAWLSVSPASGTAPQTLQVSASIGSLTAGPYTGHVTVTAAGAQSSPSVVTMTLIVVQPPVLSVLPSGLSMSATQGGANPSAASVSVANTGGGTLNFAAASDSAWLSVSPASGTAPQTLQISASIGSLTAGTYTGHVTVTAAGAQGSPSVVTVTLVVVLPGVVVGQVLSDATGLPYKGATVQVEGGANQDSSRDSGAYSIPVINNHFFLSIGVAPNGSTGAPGTVTIEREVFAQPGIGTIPVDARVTPISPSTSISPSGGSVSSGSLTVTIPPGSVSSTANFHLTTLSPQGLPGLLPLGWSPVAAFDLRSDTPTAVTFSANFTQLTSAQTMNLATYDYTQHAWTMVTPNLGAINGSLTIPLPSVGSFALVTADVGNTSLQVPSTGQPLTGVAVVMLPGNTTSSGSLSPPSISPTGGTSTATLAVQSPTPLPSGTVIQANVTGTYSLVSGKQLSDPARTEDILLYQLGAPAGSAGVATFPVTPLQTFALGQLASGDVHLDILSGRESIRGQVGGSDPVTVTGGDATLTVAAGSLTQDTAVSVNPESTDTFLPTTPLLIPLAEYNIDFSGMILSTAAQLSVAAGTAQPGDNIFLAQVQRLAGAPYLVVISLAQVTGSNLVTQAAAGLPGITQGGDYVFYKVTSPTGFVSGTVSSSSGPTTAVVQTDGLPFVTFASMSGSYVIPALSGQVNLTASVPNTALSGTASLQVVAGQTATSNITVIGQVESATVTPANGSVGVPLTAEIDVTAPDAFNAVPVTTANFTLMQTAQGSNTPIPLRFVFSQGNTKIAVFPQSALQPSSTFTFAASGLANVVGGLTTVPTITFTTQAITPPNFNTDALVFAMPDQNGNVQIYAPASSFPPGTTILIVDQTNGIVLSLTVFNDGSVSGQLPATIDDVLLVTITAPDKTTATFTRSQFVAPDGTTAVGAGGGTVTGPGGVELRIPQGALDKGVTFKITSFGPTLFPERPDLPNANFGGGLTITSTAMPTFNKEVKLAFPKPTDAPDGSFYYVYRRLSGPNNTYTFEVIDHAFVEGTGALAKVVTGAPFPGLNNSISAFSMDSAGGFVVQSLESQNEFLMWTYDSLLPGIASQGVLVGKALRTIPPLPGETEPTYVPIAGATVWRSDDTQMKTVARTDVNGRYSLFDPSLSGGTRTMMANLIGEPTINVMAAEVVTAQPDDAYYGVDPALYRYYRNVGRANPIFPPAAPQPPAPTLDIRIYRVDASGNRTLANGIVTTGDSLVFGIKLNSGASVTLTSLTVGSQSLTFSNNDTGTPKMDFISTQPYSAALPGASTVTAVALPALGGAAITQNRSFLVTAAGGGVNPDPNNAPTVIFEFPRNHSLRVPTTVFPQVQFSQPVKNIPGNVTLVGNDGSTVVFTLSGAGLPDSTGNPVPLASLTSTSVVTSITLQPTEGLKYGMKYLLTLSSAIVDTTSSARGLVSSPIDFTTTSPQNLAQTSDQFPSPRVVVLGNYAYVAHLTGTDSNDIRVYDVSDPAVLGSSLGSQTIVGGRPADLAGEENSPVNSGFPLLAVATGITTGVDSSIARLYPSSVYVYDVRQPTQFNLMGAVSMTSSAIDDGVVLRLAMFNDQLYAATFQKGIQILDLTNAYFTQPPIQRATKFALSPPTPITIPVTQNPDGTGTPIVLFDLKVGNYIVNSVPKTVVFATGQTGLVVVDPSPTRGPSNPNALFVLSEGNIDGATGTHLDSGYALALGSVNSLNIALIVGQGAGIAPTTGVLTAGPVMAVVDLTDPSHPVPLYILALPESATDVAIRSVDGLALVALSTRTLLVDLQDPRNPQIAGEIDGIGGRLTLTSSNFIFSTAFTPPAQGGIHSAVLGSVCASLRTRLQSGTSVDNVSYPLQSLDWTIGKDSSFSPQDGFVLTAVQLGDRLMANKMSLPYVVLQRTPTSPATPGSLQCVLSKDPIVACSGSLTARSQLLQFRYTPSNQNFFALEAQYLLDRLDGDPDVTPEVPDSCAVVTQRYEFWREGYDAPETSDELSAARFKPIVKYQYFTDPTGPVLKSFNMAQRFQYSPTAFQSDNTTSPPTFSYPSSSVEIGALFLDCELTDFLTHAGCESIFTSINHLGTATPNGNPLQNETTIRVIQNGLAPDSLSLASTTGDPASPLKRADNLHLRSFAGSADIFGNPQIEGPTDTGHPGCPECVHTHWRWGSLLDRSHFPGIAVASPRFDNNAGNPIIPPGSKQDVDVGILVAKVGGGNGTEEHPSFPQTFLTFATSKSISGQVPLSFWYSATGHSNQDSFMLHGGFFSSLRVVISNPYITDIGNAAGALDPLPLQSFTKCQSADMQGGTCPIKTDINNRTGHSVTWTMTIIDKSTGLPVKTTTGNIGGALFKEFTDTAKIYIPANTNLFPTYILDVKVEDDVTHWTTERQSYVTVGGIATLFVPLFQ